MPSYLTTQHVELEARIADSADPARSHQPTQQIGADDHQRVRRTAPEDPGFITCEIFGPTP
jgi:hypothetical protein